MFVVALRKKSVLRFLCLMLVVCLSGVAAVVCLASSDPGVTLPILMYHAILKDPGRTGEYVVTPASLEQDMQFLQEHGYTTVFMSEVIDYVYNRADLPEKPVVLSFDDGHYNNLTYLTGLLEKYHMKAVIAPVGEYVQQYTDHPDPNPAYAYLTWQDLSDLSQSGYFEILNHTYNMHNYQGRKGTCKKQGETSAQYRKAFLEDVGYMQECLREKSSICATTFVYPFGRICKESLDLVKELGFSASLSCYEHTNQLTHNPECLYQLGRFNRSGLYSTEQIMKKAKIVK